jgi:hypothetical protein
MYEIKEADGSTTFTGARLKFYYDDFKLYAEEYHLALTAVQTKAICKKLARHFKVRVWFGWKKGRGGLYRRSWSNGGEIYMPQGKADLGLLCHEVSHAIHHQRYHKRGHTKQLRRIMGRVIKYCQRKQYWHLQAAPVAALPALLPPNPSNVSPLAGHAEAVESSAVVVEVAGI